MQTESPGFRAFFLCATNEAKLASLALCGAAFLSVHTVSLLSLPVGAQTCNSLLPVTISRCLCSLLYLIHLYFSSFIVNIDSLLSVPAFLFLYVCLCIFYCLSRVLFFRGLYKRCYNVHTCLKQMDLCLDFTSGIYTSKKGNWLALQVRIFFSVST